MLISQRLPLIFGVPDKAFFEDFKEKKAFVAELRPGLEGTRVVAEALLKRGIRPVVICDNMMAFCMQQGKVSSVHIFYKELKNKTAVCRTGSLTAALAAEAHKIPAYLHRASGVKYKQSDLRKIAGKTITVPSVKTYAPMYEDVPLGLVNVRG